MLYRLFNRISTWQLLERAHSPICIRTFDSERFGETLDEAINRRESIYTNAFILCANDAFGLRRKHRNHLALVDLMTREELPFRIGQSKSLQEIYELLIAYPLFGPFMAYQLAIDLNYSDLVDFDENDFTMPGPGAIRGIRKCFTDLGTFSRQDVIGWMAERQDLEFDRLNLAFESLFGRPLHAIDCQNLFCEFDKYARVAFPHLASNRSQIKTKFKPTTTSIELFYPPKWGINDRIEDYLRFFTVSRPNL
jgi:hypothetical protein